MRERVREREEERKGDKENKRVHVCHTRKSAQEQEC